MSLTSEDFLNQIIDQARILDPSASFEIGTPEYKIASAVAVSLANNQVDMTGLANGLNINSKVGSNLDNFTSMLGMTRQQASAATGYVVFSRTSAAPSNIVIPQGTVLQANNVNVNTPTTVQFTTTQAGTIAQGETTSGSVAVQAVAAGSATSIPAGALNQIVGTIPTGVTAVTNPLAFTNGTDAEDDDSFKARFQNTWGRNQSGTTSAYLATALAGSFTTKAVCMGQQSTFTEYIQVPYTDDSGLLNGAPSKYTSGVVENLYADTGGVAGQWTSALSQIPYAKQILTAVTTYIQDTTLGGFYYQEGVDYNFNYPPLMNGDAVRNLSTLTAIEGGSQTITNGGSLTVSNATSFPDWGVIGWMQDYGNIGTANTPTPSWITVQYMSINADGNTFEGIVMPSTASYEIDESTPVYYVDSGANPYQPQDIQPNFTFINVDQTDSSDDVQSMQPGDIILSEYSYVSTASRNDIDLNIANCIDVYVNGSNPNQQTTTFIPNQSLVSNFTFNINSASPWYIDNFRRDGAPAKRPQAGNYFTPLFNPPVTSLPTYIQANDNTYYYLGIHYWLVHEIGQLANSVRARDGIEWNASLWGETSSTAPDLSTGIGYTPGGTEATSGIAYYAQQSDSLTITNYTNDANIVAIQGTYETNEPATTDALAHFNVTRYFKFWITMQYNQTSTSAVVQSAMQSATQAYLTNQYFGTLIQLSSVLETISATTGVQNVRWYNDLPVPPNQIRVIETDINSNQTQGISIDRYAYGQAGTQEVEYLYITGWDFGANDYFTISWSGDPAWSAGGTTAPILMADVSPLTMGTFDAPGATCTYIQGILNTVLEAAASDPYSSGVTVTPVFSNFWNTDGLGALNTTDPLMVFAITYNSPGQPYLPTITQSISQGTYLYDEDFYLMDDQLPSLPTNALATDTLAGFIIESRAENTFYRG